MGVFSGDESESGLGVVECGAKNETGDDSGDVVANSTAQGHNAHLKVACSDEEVGGVILEGFVESWEVSNVVLSVGVQDCDAFNVGVFDCFFVSEEEGESFSVVFIDVDDFGDVGFEAMGAAVGTSVVDEPDGVDVGLDITNHVCDEVAGVVYGDNDGEGFWELLNRLGQRLCLDVEGL